MSMRNVSGGWPFLWLGAVIAFGGCTFVTNNPPAPDAGPDASMGVEGGVEASVEASVEAGREASAEGGGDAAPESGPVPDPTNVDCTKPQNCYHLQCYDDPNCSSTPDPGNCPVGQVNDLSQPDGGPDGGQACRPCTADDCDGLSSYCCGADVCKNSVACGMYICAAIDATCTGVTSATCGFHDLDSDDAWGDCDEAPSDLCCFCKVAVGCVDSKCTPGQYVKNGACAACTANDCMHPPCMGLNGCATNCQAGWYFDGVKCRDCLSTSSTSLIPACNVDAGTGDAGGGDAGDDGG
jgi:hypothetical protein